jgi:hypothetical protein
MNQVAIVLIFAGGTMFGIILKYLIDRGRI